MSEEAASRPALLTFGPMIDSELSRFLLWRYAIAYREERHLFGWVSVLALVRAGTPQIPVLLGPGLVLVGPRAMLNRFEATCPAGQMLLPARQPLRSAIESDWLLFNGTLGAAVAKYAYFHLLPHPEILTAPFSRGVPEAEGRLMPFVYPVLRQLFTLLLGLSPDAAADALLRIHSIVGEAEARLADGRRFLHGDHVTLSDMALATSIAPLVLPSSYTSPLPKLAEMPPPLKAMILECRSRPIGAYTDRVYAMRTEGSAQTGTTIS